MGHRNGTLPMNAQLINPGPKMPTMHIDPAMFERDFSPVGDLVLIRMLKPKETAGGLHLPEGASDGQPKRGQIIKVGPGRMNEQANDGSRIKLDPDLKPGRLVYPMLHGTGVPHHVGDQTYYVVSAYQICGLSDAPSEQLEAR
jgi:co-chaperonin GroES (HSP10)